MKRIDKIDNLKAICILFVVITHLSWMRVERIKYLFCFWIDQAVPVFLIISGYLYSQSFRKKNITQFTEAYQFNLLVDKIVRYTIPFLFCFLFQSYNTTTPIQKFLLCFFTGGIGPGSYYFPILIQFIFIFPIIYFIVEKLDIGGG